MKVETLHVLFYISSISKYWRAQARQRTAIFWNEQKKSGNIWVTVHLLYIFLINCAKCSKSEDTSPEKIPEG